MLVISFHSLEDRIVKHAFREDGALGSGHAQTHHGGRRRAGCQQSIPLSQDARRAKNRRRPNEHQLLLSDVLCRHGGLSCPAPSDQLFMQLLGFIGHLARQVVLLAQVVLQVVQLQVPILQELQSVSTGRFG